MLLAHLSDPHLVTGPLAPGPATGLHAALGRILGLETRPDAIVITGDLAERGSVESYDQLAQLLSEVPLPVYLAAGNHDDRGALLGAFGGTSHLGGQHATYYAVDLPGARLLVLDSLVPGSGSGRLGQEQLTWLENQLSSDVETPVLLALHHPPVAVGIPFLDRMGLLDAGAFAEVVSAHAQVVRVLCGHVHRTVTAPFATALVTAAGSTYRQSALDMTEPGTMGYLEEPTSFLLHQMNDATDGLCVTHSVAITGAAAVHFALPPQGDKSESPERSSLT